MSLESLESAKHSSEAQESLTKYLEEHPKEDDHEEYDLEEEKDLEV